MRNRGVALGVGLGLTLSSCFGGPTGEGVSSPTTEITAAPGTSALPPVLELIGINVTVTGGDVYAYDSPASVKRRSAGLITGQTVMAYCISDGSHNNVGIGDPDNDLPMGFVRIPKDSQVEDGAPNNFNVSFDDLLGLSRCINPAQSVTA